VSLRDSDRTDLYQNSCTIPTHCTLGPAPTASDPLANALPAGTIRALPLVAFVLTTTTCTLDLVQSNLAEVGLLE
jgi:hypothetical protein